MTELKPGAAGEPWFEPAHAALSLALAGKLDPAMDVVEDIYVKHEWQGLQSAMQMWCDAAMKARGIAPGTLIKPMWKHVDSPELHDADSTPEEARWAGRMLAARIAMDFDQWTALMGSMPQNVGGCVEAMLTICVLQIRKGPL